MAWFTCVNYYCFSYVVIYAPHVKDFVLSLGGFVAAVSFLRKNLILRKLLTLKLKGVKLTEN